MPFKAMQAARLAPLDRSGWRGACGIGSAQPADRACRPSGEMARNPPQPRSGSGL